MKIRDTQDIPRHPKTNESHPKLPQVSIQLQFLWSIVWVVWSQSLAWPHCRFAIVMPCLARLTFLESFQTCVGSCLQVLLTKGLEDCRRCQFDLLALTADDSLLEFVHLCWYLTASGVCPHGYADEIRPRLRTPIPRRQGSEEKFWKHATVGEDPTLQPSQSLPIPPKRVAWPELSPQPWEDRKFRTKKQVIPWLSHSKNFRRKGK